MAPAALEIESSRALVGHLMASVARNLAGAGLLLIIATPDGMSSHITTISFTDVISVSRATESVIDSASIGFEDWLISLCASYLHNFFNVHPNGIFQCSSKQQALHTEFGMYGDSPRIFAVLSDGQCSSASTNRTGSTRILLGGIWAGS